MPYQVLMNMWMSQRPFCSKIQLLCSAHINIPISYPYSYSFTWLLKVRWPSGLPVFHRMTPERCEQIDGAGIWKSGWIFDSSLYFYNSNKIRIFEVKTVLGAAGHMIMLDIRFWLFPEISNFFLSPFPKREQSVHSMAVYRVSPTCLALWTLQN